VIFTVAYILHYFSSYLYSIGLFIKVILLWSSVATAVYVLFSVPYVFLYHMKQIALHFIISTVSGQLDGDFSNSRISPVTLAASIARYKRTTTACYAFRLYVCPIFI